MKKNLLILLLFWLPCLTAMANSYRVNNTLPTDPAQRLYNTLLEAHNDPLVLAGDTLMIEGSTIVHPDLTMTKRLVLIGPGYLLTQNPTTQYNPSPCVMSRISIKPSASGSVLAGLTFSATQSSHAPFIEASNVIVMRCFVPNTLYLAGTTNNVQIIQNFFSTGGVAYQQTSDRFTNVTLRNNFIYRQVYIPSTDNNQRLFSVVENNIFANGALLTAASFRSNIITSTSALFTITSAAIQNNLSVGSQLPAGNGNQTYNASQLFVGEDGNSPDGQYRIKSDSPYLTAGYNNTQPGIYGGTQPYVLSGMPAIPSIYEIQASGFASQQAGLPVIIKAKVNP